MRLHPLSIVLSIPAIFLACSDGGPGTAPTPGGSSAFGQPGANLPALSPITPSGGGQTPDPQPQDTGTQTQDTGRLDTGTPVQDTATDECSTLMQSTCSADPPPSSSTLATCRSQLSGTCASQWRTFWQCISTRRVCDSTTNTTDTAATAAACSAEQEAASTCGA